MMINGYLAKQISDGAFHDNLQHHHMLENKKADPKHGISITLAMYFG